MCRIVVRDSRIVFVQIFVEFRKCVKTNDGSDNISVDKIIQIIVKAHFILPDGFF